MSQAPILHFARQLLRNYMEYPCHLYFDLNKNNSSRLVALCCQQTLFSISFLAWYNIKYSILVFLHAALAVQLTLNSFCLPVVSTLKLKGGKGVAES